MRLLKCSTTVYLLLRLMDLPVGRNFAYHMRLLRTDDVCAYIELICHCDSRTGCEVHTESNEQTPIHALSLHQQFPPSSVCGLVVSEQSFLNVIFNLI